MKPAHTPGPWTFAKGKHRIEVRTTPALSYAFSLSDEANARLIASAPELLEALERISTAYDETLRHPIATELLRAIYQSRAAIAKAKWGAEGGAE